MNFFKDYRFQLNDREKYLISKFGPHYLVTLNINCIYWIDAKLIRSAVTKLKLLEILYVIDTKVRFSRLDISTYNKIKKVRRKILYCSEKIK